MTDLDALKSLTEAATPGPWHWAGNTDTGEPYLATWLPGAGRCQIFSIGYEERSTTGRAAEQVRSNAVEFGLGDPDELVQQWAHDSFGQPVREPRLQFMTDLMCVDARDLVVYEVAPDATTRDDPNVYRADITDIRHPDAELIAAARTAVPELIERVEAAEKRIAAVEALHAPDTVMRDYCAECSDFGSDQHPVGQLIEYPCSTIRALSGEPDV